MYEPKLRFTADDGSKFPDWEEKKLGEVATRVTRKNKDNITNIPLTISSVDGLIDQRDFFNKVVASKDMSGYYLLNNGEFAYNKSYSKGYDFGSIKRLDLYDCGALSTLYICFALDGKENSDFYQKYFDSLLWYSELQKICAEGARNHGLLNVPTNDFFQLKLCVPSSKDEQQKIADFLSIIDAVIEKQKETVEVWEERKKGVMQKLFSQDVRFKADDGSEFPDWEEKSFEQTFSNLNNSTFSRDCLNYENGNVKYIHYGDILVKFGATVNVTDCIVPYLNDDLNCEKYNTLENGDVVIADTAEDETVGKVVEISETDPQKTISGLHTIACRPREKFASKYLGYFMNSDAYHNQLRPYMQGIKVTSISKANIKLTSILIPCLAEQQKIADCLSALDDVIDKQKATLATWKEMKKGLLQQMFV